MFYIQELNGLRDIIVYNLRPRDPLEANEDIFTHYSSFQYALFSDRSMVYSKSFGQKPKVASNSQKKIYNELLEDLKESVKTAAQEINTEKITLLKELFKDQKKREIIRKKIEQELIKRLEEPIVIPPVKKEPEKQEPKEQPKIEIEKKEQPIIKEEKPKVVVEKFLNGLFDELKILQSRLQSLENVLLKFNK